jgi:hypothetical protein
MTELLVIQLQEGNNVHAYEDKDSNLPGISLDGGATRNFDYPFSINEIPLIIRMLQLPIYFISIIKFMIFSICLVLRQLQETFRILILD